MTTARTGSTPSSFAAIKKVSGAGLPASRCAWIVLPSTRTSKKASSLADELSGARGGKEHFPVGAPALLRRPDPECIEALRQRGDGLICCEDAFAFCNEHQRDALQSMARHAASSLCCIL